MVKIAVSVTSLSEWEQAEEFGADLIELRLDLTEHPENLLSAALRKKPEAPLIVTMRSVEEGGLFSGTDDAWFTAVQPWAEVAAYVDIEQRWATFAPVVRDHGTGIIASVHRNDMPSQDGLDRILRDLRAYGDIPKIVVTPSSRADVLGLCSFTLAAGNPVCTGVMGTAFRYARVLLTLFGSELAYCHAGTPTAGGQFHVAEFRDVLEKIQ